MHRVEPGDIVARTRFSDAKLARLEFLVATGIDVPLRLSPDVSGPRTAGPVPRRSSHYYCTAAAGVTWATQMSRVLHVVAEARAHLSEPMTHARADTCLHSRPPPIDRAAHVQREVGRGVWPTVCELGGRQAVRRPRDVLRGAGPRGRRASVATPSCCDAYARTGGAQGARRQVRVAATLVVARLRSTPDAGP